MWRPQLPKLNESGSLTLEACVVLPVFLLFMLFIINLVNVAMIYLAMDHALSETVKQIATQAYRQKYVTPAMPGVVEALTRVKLPQAYPLPKFPGAKMTIRTLRLGREDIGVEVTYPIKVPAPFLAGGKLVLSNRAVERAWEDDPSTRSR
ncbi:MAG TPA: TadE family protein [Bacillota bacterium]|nr:TadE family protein [Bacillota bacterium]